MNADALFALLSEARTLCGHADYVVIGSLSVLGMEDVAAIPADMTMSIDADCWTLSDPGRIDDLRPALGEGSDYHRAHGIYLDPVSPQLPTLPAGWEARLIPVVRQGVVAHFLEPHDAAVSKLARGEERDLRWARAGARANLLSLATVALRMKTANFYDKDEQATALAMLEQLNAGRAAKPRTRSR
ncbi:MAG: DUF6036 family nucleotidyltransferase [Ramlibacter sp.]